MQLCDPGLTSHNSPALEQAFFAKLGSNAKKSGDTVNARFDRRQRIHATLRGGV
jgi:hypothetical protein